MAKVACPACRQMNSYPVIEAGAELACQHCGQAFRVRGPGGSSPPKTPASAGLPPLDPNAPLPPAGVAPSSSAPSPFGAQAPLSPLAPLNPLQPVSSPFVSSQPQPGIPATSAFAPLQPGMPPPGFQPTPPNSGSFGSPSSLPSKPAWNPPAPQPPRTNNLAIIIGIAGFCGVAFLFCGGLAFLFFMGAKSKVVEAARQAEQQNARRQLEMQRQMQEQQRLARQLNERTINPAQPTPNNPANNSVAKSKSNPRPAPSFDPPPITRPPIDFPPPTDFGPPAGFSSRNTRKPPTNDTERLDQLLEDLQRGTPARPRFITLSELDRLPVLEDRRGEVSQALEPLLNSGDLSIARNALKALGKWGTDANVATVTSLLDSPDLSIRWEAIRTLPKLSKSAATAEALTTKLHDFGNIGPLRDAFKELGAVGEPALVSHLKSDDRMTRQATHMILAEVGGELTRAALRELIQSEKDFGAKAMAEQTLRRIESRKP